MTISPTDLPITICIVFLVFVFFYLFRSSRVTFFTFAIKTYYCDQGKTSRVLLLLLLLVVQ